MAVDPRLLRFAEDEIARISPEVKERVTSGTGVFVDRPAIASFRAREIVIQ